MKLSHILAAVDFSDTATRAAKWAIECFAPDAELTLLHVVDLVRHPPFAHRALPPEAEIASVATEYAVERMHELSTFLMPGAVNAEVRVGKPHDQVAAVAEQVAADLVVIGPHGDRPRRSRFLGTTADRITRTSPVPVLVATQPPAHAPTRILAAVDDCAVTPLVLAWTGDLAARFEAEVTLLHVWSNAVYSHVASTCYATAQSESDAQADIQQELHDAAARWLDEAARTGVKRDRVTAVVKFGNVGDVVIETAEARGTDLIVLGRAGAGLVAPALLGSTVAAVLHEARCPVLVIPEPARGSERDGA